MIIALQELHLAARNERKQNMLYKPESPTDIRFRVYLGLLLPQKQAVARTKPGFTVCYLLLVGRQPRNPQNPSYPLLNHRTHEHNVYQP